MSFLLRIMPPKEPPVEYALDLDRIRIGRSETNDIVIKTPQVSSQHLELRREGDSFLLVDRDSTNGTRVNGKEVNEVLLRDGDELLIGNQVAAVFSQRGQVAADAGDETAPVATVAVADSEQAAAKPAPVPMPAQPRPAVPAIPVASPRKPAPSVPAQPVQVAKPAVPGIPKPAVPAARPALKPATPVSAAAKPSTGASSPGSAAPTVVIKRSAGASVPPARPPIKIAKPMPPGARQGDDS